jgi:hypothetical protein
VLDSRNILWHFGALSATGAAVAVVASVHPSARGFWILLVSLVFLGAYAAGSVALLRLGERIPGGVVASTAVSFVPVAAVGFERLIGVWSGSPRSAEATFGVDPSTVVVHRFNGHEFAVAVATAIAGLVVYAIVRYAFVFAWVAVAALAAVQFFLPAVDGSPRGVERSGTLLVTGLVFVAIGLYADLVRGRREAFWWHLVGLLAITGGFAYNVVFRESPGWVIALLAGVVALAGAVPLRRATWALFGLLGLWAPVVHYTAAWFGNLGTAFALFVVGLLILGAGLVVGHIDGPGPFRAAGRPEPA